MTKVAILEKAAGPTIVRDAPVRGPTIVRDAPVRGPTIVRDALRVPPLAALSL